MTQGLKTNNHFIPQMILKNFTNKDGMIYEFLLKEKKWHLPNGNATDGGMTTFGVGKEKNLYIQEDINGNLSDKMENALAYLEDANAETVKKLIKYESKDFLTDLIAFLDPEEYSNFIFFLVNSFLRTPNTLNKIAQGMAGILLKEFSIHLQNSNSPHLSDEQKKIESLNKNFKVVISNQMLLYNTFKEERISEISDLLSNYQFFLLNNKTRFFFIMGDSFINLQKPGLAKTNTIYIPLGNNKALVGSNLGYRDVKVMNQGFEGKQKQEELIKECNCYAIANAESSIYLSTKSDTIKNFILKNYVEKNVKIFGGENNSPITPNYTRENVKKKIKKTN